MTLLPTSSSVCSTNVPNHPHPKLAPTYTGILDWLKTAKLRDFQCQNGQVTLFGLHREQWSVGKSQVFVKAVRELGNMGLRMSAAAHASVPQNEPEIIHKEGT